MAPIAAHPLDGPNSPLMLFKDCTSSEVHQRLAHLGVTPRLARRLQAHILRGTSDEMPRQMDEVSPQLLSRVRDAATVPRLSLVERAISARDGFAKYLFQGSNGTLFETVRIPLTESGREKRYVVCVSSQAGCGMGCAYCATARLGFQRNLATWEIVDQVVQVRRDSDHPVRGVVFMGMGEPFLNYDRVIQSARVFSEPCGLAIASKSITISTVGIVPAIRRFTAEQHPYKLVVSLTSADEEQRRQLMPVTNAHPLAPLMESIRHYHRETGRRVTLAWTAMAGVNMGLADARALAQLTAGLPITLDLIEVNDPRGVFRAPTREELDAFRDLLRRELAMPVARRYSGGQDVHAGCGMLSAIRQLGGPAQA